MNMSRLMHSMICMETSDQRSENVLNADIQSGPQVKPLKDKCDICGSEYKVHRDEKSRSLLCKRWLYWQLFQDLVRKGDKSIDLNRKCEKFLLIHLGLRARACGRVFG